MLLIKRVPCYFRLSVSRSPFINFFFVFITFTICNIRFHLLVVPFYAFIFLYAVRVKELPKLSTKFPQTNRREGKRFDLFASRKLQRQTNRIFYHKLIENLIHREKKTTCRVKMNDFSFRLTVFQKLIRSPSQWQTSSYFLRSN